MKQFECVIFDWAGTTVDYGCFAPVQAFVEVFKHYGIEPTMEEVREPMGDAENRSYPYYAAHAENSETLGRKVRTGFHRRRCGKNCMVCLKKS